MDAVYMTATQAMTGQGGWPMTVFLTPDGEPFYCGTYYPPRLLPRSLPAIPQAWTQAARRRVDRAGRHVADAGRDAAPPPRRLTAPAGRAGASRPPTAATRARRELRRAARRLRRRAQVPAVHGAASSCCATHERTGDARPATWPSDLRRHGPRRHVRPARRRLRPVLRRRRLVVPHFEKMLYDNALLARVYADLWRRTGSALARRVAARDLTTCSRELRTAEGGFAAALDADSDGEEGTPTSGRPAQLAAVLGTETPVRGRAPSASPTTGTFEHGASVLQLREDPADPPRRAPVDRMRRGCSSRGRAHPPGRDDKVVAAWNGLAISALAETGLLLGRPGLHRRRAVNRRACCPPAPDRRPPGPHLPRRHGRAAAGALDDYACLAEGFLTPVRGDGGGGGWPWPATCSRSPWTAFTDGTGGFYDTANDDEQLDLRPPTRPTTPRRRGPSPSTGALLGYSALTGRLVTARRPRRRSACCPASRPASHGAAGAGLAAAQAWLSGPAEIAVVGPAEDERTQALHWTARARRPPGAVLALGDGTSADVPRSRAVAWSGRSRRVRLPSVHLPGPGHHAQSAPRVPAREPVTTAGSPAGISEIGSSPILRVLALGLHQMMPRSRPTVAGSIGWRSHRWWASRPASVAK